MQHSMLIIAHPASGVHETAITTLQQILEREESLYCLFFYRQAVRIADNTTTSRHLWSSWLKLLHRYRIEAVICSGALSRLGLNDSELPQSCPEGGFIAGGLGQWADAVRNSDHVLQFGGTPLLADMRESRCT